MFRAYLLVCLFFLTFNSNARAEESFLCSAFYAKSVDSPEYSDKFKHCTVSCMLTLRCGPVDAYQVGLMKEILDLLGMGQPEVDDIKANMTGIKLVLKRQATTDNECLIGCGKFY